MGVAVIHVVDDHGTTSSSSSSSSKEFRCDIKLLHAHMRLLRPTCAAVAPGQDIEITVKCDISTFAFLMAYVKAADSSEQQPEPSLSNCVQLLLASHYLQIPPVLRSCVAFIAASLLALAPTAAAQLCSLESCLLDKVAKAVQEEVLEALHHRYQPQPLSSSSHDSSSAACALVEKLYKHKLKALLRQQNSTLLRCSACGQVYASASHHKLLCRAGHTSANRHSRLPLHELDPSWALQTFLAQCRTSTSKPRPHQQDLLHLQGGVHALAHLTQGGLHAAQLSTQQAQHQEGQDTQEEKEEEEDAPLSWRQLYWFVWGYVVVLYCQRCCSHFPARQLHQCSYHPLAPVFASEDTSGQYPCCGAPAWHPGGSAVVAAAAASLQPCCSRDHDTYVPQATGSSAAGSPGQRVLQQQGQGGTGPVMPIAASRALQLLQLYGPLITSAGPAATQLQRQQQQHGQGGVAAGAAEAAALRSAGPVCMSEQQQQPACEKVTQHTLPLLVKMVNRGAASAAAAADSSSGGGGGAGSTAPGSRPSCVSPLPPISPRQQVPAAAHQQSGHGSACVGGSSKPHHVPKLGQQGGFDLPAAAAAAIGAAAAAGANTGHHARRLHASSQPDDDDGSSSDSGSSSSSEGKGKDSRVSESGRSSPSSSGSTSSSSDVSTGSGADAAFPSSLTNNSDFVAELEGSDGFSLTGVHPTPLSSMIGAVRTAAEARSRQGVAAPGSSAAGSSSAAARLHQLGAPLPGTFSPGGKRVLSAATRKPGRPSSQIDSTDSRPSTAASLLSLKQQQQQQGLGRKSPSRPGTGSIAARAFTAAAAAAAPPDSGSGGARAGGTSAALCAFNRTLLLELVQQDDAHRMAVLMRKLDSLRLQPPPDCGEQQQQQGRQQQQQQLTQVDVMKAVNRVIFQGV